MIEVIDLGNFNINQLPKLQREESACNRYLTKTSDEFRMSLDGSKVEFITTRTKLQSAFPNLQLFLSAWQVYISVRTQYHPEYSSSLVFWTERLIYRAFIHPWDAVLNYAIAYFQAHQKDPPASWFHLDSDLISDTIVSTFSHSIMNTSSRPRIPSSNMINNDDKHLSELESIKMFCKRNNRLRLHASSCLQHLFQRRSQSITMSSNIINNNHIFIFNKINSHKSNKNYFKSIYNILIIYKNFIY